MATNMATTIADTRSGRFNNQQNNNVGICPVTIKYKNHDYLRIDHSRKWRPIVAFWSSEDPDGLLLWIKGRWNNPNVIKELNRGFLQRQVHSSIEVCVLQEIDSDQPIWYVESPGIGKPTPIASLGLIENYTSIFFEELVKVLYEMTKVSPSPKVLLEEDSLLSNPPHKPAWYKQDELDERDIDTIKQLGIVDEIGIFDIYPQGRTSRRWTLGTFVPEDIFLGENEKFHLIVGPQGAYRDNWSANFARLLVYCSENDQTMQHAIAAIKGLVSQMPSDEESDWERDRFLLLFNASVAVSFAARYRALTKPDTKWDHDRQLINEVKKRQSAKGKTLEDHLTQLATLIQSVLTGEGVFDGFLPDFRNQALFF